MTNACGLVSVGSRKLFAVTHLQSVGQGCFGCVVSALEKP